MASWAPVEAPEGTAARPSEPSSRTTSTSIVGDPRLSRISRALMSRIEVMVNLRAGDAGFMGGELRLQGGENGCPLLGMVSRGTGTNSVRYKGGKAAFRRAPRRNLQPK